MNCVLTLNEVSFAYPGQRSLLNGLNGEIDLARITWLTGENGSGKTTFCRIIMGLERRYRGNLYVGSQELRRLSSTEIARSWLYLKQEPMANLLAISALEDLKSRQTRFATPDTEALQETREEALDEMWMEDLAEEPVWKLSGGETRAVGLSSMRLGDIPYCILDEPFEGLDDERVSVLLQLIDDRRQHGEGMLIISRRNYGVAADEHLLLRTGKLLRE